jgi:DNA polymerase-1
VLNGAELLVGHNLGKHDIEVLYEHNLLKDENHPFADTLVMFHMLYEEHWSKDLTAVSTFYGGKPKNRSSLLQQIIDNLGWYYVPIEETSIYCVNDSEISAEAFDSIMLEWGAQFSESLWDREQRFIRAIGRLERNRVRIDPELCRQQELRGTLEMDTLQTELGFNPNSGKDLQEILINRLNLPVVKWGKPTKKGIKNPSFDKKAMQIYEEEYLPFVSGSDKDLAKKILRYRGWSKAVSSYYRAWLNLMDGNNEIRCSFKIHGTVTGRLSCERPNLQQIPREGEEDWNRLTKKCFLARPGNILVEWDYSQLEFRLAAAVAKEEKLLEIFRSGEDIFTAMAEDIGWERYQMKTMVYLTLYGGGNNRAADAFGIPVQQAARLRSEFFKRYPRLRDIARYSQDVMKKQGYIEYWTGRRRHAPDDGKYHIAFNAWVQGGAFEIVKDAIIRLDEVCSEKKDLKMVLQVHDSVWTEYPIEKQGEYDPLIKHTLEAVPQPFGVPFVVEKKILHISEHRN